MVLNINCIPMTHHCIYHWNPDSELNFSSPLKNLEHYNAGIQLWMTENLLKLNNDKINMTYLASPKNSITDWRSFHYPRWASKKSR